MRGFGPRPAAELGDLVRAASKHRGHFPRISVWHGSADRTVSPSNAGEIVKQWLDVHHLPETPMSETVADGHPRQVWWSGDGDTIVESYTVTDMAHGTPLGRADDGRRYGRKGMFQLEAGISSSYHIAKFFGLTHWIRDARPAIPQTPSTRLIPQVSLTAPVASAARPKAERPQVAEPEPASRAQAPVQATPERAKVQPVARRDAGEPSKLGKPKLAPKKRRRVLEDISGAVVRAMVSAGLLQRR
jgi:hypothetical protein